MPDILSCLHLFFMGWCLLISSAANPSASPTFTKSSSASIVYHINQLQLPTNASKINTNSLWRYCATPSKWSRPPRIRLEDCKGAVEWLFLEEMRTDRTEQREFLSPGVEKMTPLRYYEATPRRYTFGKFSHVSNIFFFFEMFEAGSNLFELWMIWF